MDKILQEIKNSEEGYRHVLRNWKVDLDNVIVLLQEERFHLLLK